jgi:hypothetical protein
MIHSLQKFHKYLHGKEFTIHCDNKPVVSLFSENKNIPTMAKMRLQRWGVILGGYSYTLKFKKGSDLILPDYMSRKPLPIQDKIDQTINVVQEVRELELPVQTIQIAAETNKDPVLSRVLNLTMSGWPEHCSDEAIKPFWLKREIIGIEQNCLMLGERIIIPKTLQSFVMSLLHESHPGMVRMKLLARSIIWWPNIDREIENFVQCCKTCQAVQRAETPLLNDWPNCMRRMQRIHIDFCTFKQLTYLIIIDSFSKWLEVMPVATTDFVSTSAALDTFFSVHGFCDTLISDGGPPFTSSQFATYVKGRGIRHILSPAYHPRSNGLAERAVQTFKSFLKKVYLDNPNMTSKGLNKKILNFLFNYRNTPSTINVFEL